MARKVNFEIDKYYHIYNRGTEKRKIFMGKGDLYYFFDTIQISNVINSTKSGDRNLSRKKIKNKIGQVGPSEKLVEIVAYALLPNHYHFILKEIKDGGISKFMQRLGTSYTMYFNEKYERSGVLFQGKFKASLLAYENSLEKTSAYVNLNYKHHKIDPEKSLVKTSLFEYLGTEKGESICNSEEIEKIISEARGLNEYKKVLKKVSRFSIEEHGHKIDGIDFKELEK